MAQFDLLKFVPFQLNRLAAEISQEMAKAYADQFDVNITEWRIIATLADEGNCTAQQIVNSTRTHKSRISRETKRLVEKGIVQRSDGGRREVQLRLTRKGTALHKKVVPVIRKKEEEVLSCLGAEERKSFVEALDILERSLDLVRNSNEKPD